MKIIFKIYFIFLCFISFSSFASADDSKCSVKTKAEVNKAAGKVKVDYEIITREDGNQYFIISIYNITSDLYVVINNLTENKSVTIGYNDTNDGTYSFEVDDIISIIKYNVEVHSNVLNCVGLLKNISLIKPRYNDISEDMVCFNDDVKDSQYCQEWTTIYFSLSKNEILKKLDEQHKLHTTTTPAVEQNKDVINDADKILLKKKKARISLIIFNLVCLIVLAIYMLIKRKNIKDAEFE